MFDVDYHFLKHWALAGLFGSRVFTSETANMTDQQWINTSANIRYYKPVRPTLNIYAGTGPGFYRSGEGSNRGGINAGLGIDYDITGLIHLELGVDYHYLFNDELRFFQSYVGVVFRL